MIKGVAAGFLSYLLFSFCDACIKALGPRLNIFEIAFFVTVASLSMFGFARGKSEAWSEILKMNRPGLVIFRAAAGAAGGLLGVYSFTTLPFAEAYSVLFLMPVFATLLSIPMLGEKIGWRRGLAVAIGFVGVLLVVRPGFRELHLGHVTAALASICSAAALLTLRKLGPTEKRITLLGYAYIIAIAVDAVLMVPTFKWPETNDFGLIVLAGLFAGIAQIFMLYATRHAPTNRVAPAQYSQILSAVAVGAMFFGEYPDGLAFIGMGLVAFSGLFTFLREEQLRGWSARTLLMRNRSVG